MAIRTTVAPRYVWTQMIWAVACLVLGVWGCYDLWIKIPAQEDLVERYRAATAAYAELEQKTVRTPAEQERMEDLSTALDQFTEAPEPPSTFDRLTQWMFISLLVCVPYFLWDVKKARARIYTLEDDGSLHLPGGKHWASEDIVDIDMSRWMKKSIAMVEHRDGTREKLDAYLYRDLEQIIGRIANRFYPEQWNADGTQIKPKPADQPDEHEHRDEEEDSRPVSPE